MQYTYHTAFYTHIICFILQDKKRLIKKRELMKKIIILSLCFMLSDFCAPAFAQETLSLQECREMALKYDKEMAASIKTDGKHPLHSQKLQRELFPQFYSQRYRTLQ